MRARDGRIDRRTAAGVFALALAARLSLVLLAPGVPTGDGFIYQQYARAIAAGDGYVNLDGSPAIMWMPGWPGFLAGIYSVFGTDPKIGMIANALLGAATAVVLATLGTTLLSRRIGALAGGLYAVWPGLVFYCATLYTETLFSFTLVCTLALLAAGCGAVGRRLIWFGAAGLGLGLCALVKSEPLALSPVVLATLWTARRSSADFARCAAATFLVTGLVMLPWVVRNQRVFDRFIPTTAGGGTIVWLGNHEGARGGNDFAAAKEYWERHARPTAAESNLAQDAAGWGDAWRFVRDHPGEELSILGNKLRMTYRSDAQGVNAALGPLRRPGAPDLATRLRLISAANAYWIAVLLLAGIGLLSWRSWRRETRMLLLGLVATWVGLHLVFLGGPRFHVPEALAYALFAACGIERLAQIAARSLARIR